MSKDCAGEEAIELGWRGGRETEGERPSKEREPCEPSRRRDDRVSKEGED